MGGRLFKRGRIWHGWVRHEDGSLKRHSTKCTDRRAAELVISQLEREHADPATQATRKTTTAKLLDDYVRSRIRMKRRPDSIEFVRKKSGVLLSLLPVLVWQISHSRLLEYVDTRQKEGVMNTTILKELRVLGAAWKLGLRNGTVRVPWETVCPELDDDHEDRDRYVLPWEMVGLATVLPEHRAAWVAFSVATGAEYAAMRRAREGDASKDFVTVHVRGTKRRTRDRIAVLALREQRALLEWALAHADGGVGGRLFSAWPNVRNDLAKACEHLGIPRLSPNDLRRTYGKWLRIAGSAPDLIGAAMGHADSRMVERVYGKLPPDALRERLLREVNDA